MYGRRPLSGITRVSGFSFHDNPCKLDTPITGRRNIYPKEKKTLKISIVKHRIFNLDTKYILIGYANFPTGQIKIFNIITKADITSCSSVD